MLRTVFGCVCVPLASALAPHNAVLQSTASSMAKSCPRLPAPLAAWILFCAFCNCAGWVLSALHQLNQVGYLISFALALGALFLLRNRLPPLDLHAYRWSKLRRRFHRLFPLLFLVLAALVFLGGALYAPNNYDAFSYRTS